MAVEESCNSHFVAAECGSQFGEREISVAFGLEKEGCCYWNAVLKRCLEGLALADWLGYSCGEEFEMTERVEFSGDRHQAACARGRGAPLERTG